jgi:hypothetical protein
MCLVHGTPVATLDRMTMDLKVLKCGNCEELKLGVHALALGVAALCGVYNAAAWLSRRERHLAVNTIMYAALIAFERQHVSHHIAELRRPHDAPALPPDRLVNAAAKPLAVPAEVPGNLAA